MRERRICLVLGSQGSGKTTLAQALVTDARRRGARVRGVSPNGSMGFSFPGDAAGVEAWLSDRQRMQDADLLVFDDADRYVPKQPKSGSPWHHLWLMNRHFYRRNVGCDALVIGRRAQNFAGELHSGVDFLFLFQLSAGDVHGVRRLLDVAPGIALPGEPFRFLQIEPKKAQPPIVRGRTYADGSYRIDP